MSKTEQSPEFFDAVEKILKIRRIAFELALINKDLDLFTAATNGDDRFIVEKLGDNTRSAMHRYDRKVKKFYGRTDDPRKLRKLYLKVEGAAASYNDAFGSEMYAESVLAYIHANFPILADTSTEVLVDMLDDSEDSSE